MKGSIRARGAGFTAYWSTTDPADGKRKQHTRGGFRTKGSAQKFLNETLPKVDAGTWKPDAKLTVAQLLGDWLAAKRSEGLRPSTIDQYTSVIDGWLLPHVGALDVRQLTPARVGELVETLRISGSRLGRGGLSDRSVQMVVTVAKAATAWATATGLLARDPLTGYRRPRVQSAPATAWSATEARAFLAAVTDDRLAAAWTLFLVRGPRRGELAGLRWDAIDLDAGVARIVATRIVVDGKALDSTPKTASGRRTLSLDAHLVTVLRAHRRRQSEERLAAGEAWANTGHVFTNELGEPYHPDYYSDRFDDLVRAGGFRRIRLHDTRHTAASIMLGAGEAVKVVQEMMGHSSPTVTLNIYAHVLPGMAEAAGEALSETLLG